MGQASFFKTIIFNHGGAQAATSYLSLILLHFVYQVPGLLEKTKIMKIFNSKNKKVQTRDKSKYKDLILTKLVTSYFFYKSAFPPSEKFPDLLLEIVSYSKQTTRMFFMYMCSQLNCCLFEFTKHRQTRICSVAKGTTMWSTRLGVELRSRDQGKKNGALNHSAKLLITLRGSEQSYTHTLISKARITQSNKLISF